MPHVYDDRAEIIAALDAFGYLGEEWTETNIENMRRSLAAAREVAPHRAALPILPITPDVIDRALAAAEARGNVISDGPHPGRTLAATEIRATVGAMLEAAMLPDVLDKALLKDLGDEVLGGFAARFDRIEELLNGPSVIQRIRDRAYADGLAAGRDGSAAALGVPLRTRPGTRRASVDWAVAGPMLWAALGLEPGRGPM